MTEMSMPPDGVLADAAWVCTFADEIAEMRWPGVELRGSEVAAAVARAPGLDGLARDLRAWANTVTAAQRALESADHRARAGLEPR
jgi:hypothetical protein